MPNVFEFNSKFIITIDDNNIKIQPKGSIANFINKGGLKDERLIPLKSITRIEYKQPEVTTGYVQFAYSDFSILCGSQAEDKEIKITFVKEELKQASEMRALIKSKLKMHKIYLEKRF